MMLESWSSRDLRPRNLHDFKLKASFLPVKFPQILEMFAIFQMAQVTMGLRPSPRGRWEVVEDQGGAPRDLEALGIFGIF